MLPAPESGTPWISWTISKVARKRSLTEITEGASFKGSPRSAQFLEYIIWQSAAGRTAALKERTIGVELFGRTPTYDTGEDAIVRVTASDVRKRLVQHYSSAGAASIFRISLPSGGYVPELIRIPKPGTDVLTHPLPLEEISLDVAVPEAPSSVTSKYRPTFGWRYWSLPILGGVALAVGVTLSVMNRPGRLMVPEKRMWNPSSIPWAALFDSSRRVVIVASDPNIEEIQRIAHSNLSLSDYANQSYLPPGSSNLSPSELAFIKEILRGNQISAFDGSIIANLALLVSPGNGRLSVKAARNFRRKDLQTDENFVFLGSPRSNPWTSMFDPHLDFQFAFNNQTQREYIRNVHPVKGEINEYVPTAGGFDTGESFAIISVLQNPGYRGQVLLIAGASGEGTKAAGDIVADPTRWSAILQPCHLAKNGSGQSVQILLHLETMAGSPGTVGELSCHVLASAG